MTSLHWLNYRDKASPLLCRSLANLQEANLMRVGVKAASELFRKKDCFNFILKNDIRTQTAVERKRPGERNYL